jgi:hypothetical protein
VRIHINCLSAARFLLFNRGALTTTTQRCSLLHLRRWITLLAALLPLTAPASLQFDVFLGFDGIDGAAQEGKWFPAIIELKNEGPSFDAVLVVTTGQLGQQQVRRIPVELPSQTVKRINIPLFATSRFAAWDFRLIDENGRTRGEHLSRRPKTVSWEIPIIGGLSRSLRGAPALPKAAQSDLQPIAARLQSALFPDHPLALEGLAAIYLNSEMALGLRVPQVDALLGWLRLGGHLIVGVEQVSEIQSTPWLRDLLPCDVSSTATVTVGNSFQRWLADEEIRSSVSKMVAANPRSSPGAGSRRDLADLDAFKEASLPVVTGTVRDGRVLVEAGGVPLIVEAKRGSGRVTLLMFSPEREPILSWNNREWFWGKLLGVAPAHYASRGYNRPGAWSLDGLFGVLIDTKQIRKLPVSGLLLLLALYLLVIGPVDRIWLKRINRQMWTWITFPIYVVLFSGLIYYIGFRLRAGDTEWNEISIVDVHPTGDRAVHRGRTYFSIYSPVNARYPVAGEQTFATLRGEYFSSHGSQESHRMTLVQQGNNFVSELHVPVWTSQLYVSDWLERRPLPVRFNARRAENGWEVEIENLLDRPLGQAQIVLDGRIYSLPELPPKQRQTHALRLNDAMTTGDFVRSHAGQFFHAMERRRHVFGRDQRHNNLPSPAMAAMAASFTAEVNAAHGGQHRALIEEWLDLSPRMEEGEAILLVWDAGHSPGAPMHRFNPRRLNRDTLFRISATPHGSSATDL